VISVVMQTYFYVAYCEYILIIQGYYIFMIFEVQRYSTDIFALVFLPVYSGFFCFLNGIRVADKN